MIAVGKNQREYFLIIGLVRTINQINHSPIFGIGKKYTRMIRILILKYHIQIHKIKFTKKPDHICPDYMKLIVYKSISFF